MSDDDMTELTVMHTLDALHDNVLDPICEIIRLNSGMQTYAKVENVVDVLHFNHLVSQAIVILDE